MTTLAEACGPEPHWGMPALTITVIGALSAQSGDVRWALKVEKPKTTASGRKGKSTVILNLVDDVETSVPQLLRNLADVWELELP